MFTNQGWQANLSPNNALAGVQQPQPVGQPMPMGPGFVPPRFRPGFVPEENSLAGRLSALSSFLPGDMGQALTQGVGHWNDTQGWMRERPRFGQPGLVSPLERQQQMQTWRAAMPRFNFGG